MKSMHYVTLGVDAPAAWHAWQYHVHGRHRRLSNRVALEHSTLAQCASCAAGVARFREWLTRLGLGRCRLRWRLQARLWRSTRRPARNEQSAKRVADAPGLPSVYTTCSHLAQAMSRQPSSGQSVVQQKHMRRAASD